MLRFYVFFIFAIKLAIKNDVLTSHLTVVTVSKTLRKRLENTQKFTFDFVVFRFSLSTPELGDIIA